MALYPQDVITREIIDNELRIESPEPTSPEEVDLDGAGNHRAVGGREHAPLFRRVRR
jgi:hypothetical protein